MCPTDAGNVEFFFSFSHSFYEYAPFYAVAIVKFDIFSSIKETYEEEILNAPWKSLLKDFECAGYCKTTITNTLLEVCPTLGEHCWELHNWRSNNICPKLRC